MSVITNFLGEIRNRFIVYQGPRALTEKFEMAKRINGADGLEIAFPQDFGDCGLLKGLIAESGFEISAINFRSRRDGLWFRGSFTSNNDKDRREMADDFKKCIDKAKDLGVTRITSCPLNEGMDYLFELDYSKAYDSMLETMRDIADYAAMNAEGLKLCIEYKYSEPRTRCLLGSAGETLAFCQELGRDNVGVNLDFGHALLAGERPGQVVAMLHRAGRLFYVHMNDNDRMADWDMIPGAYNFWDSVEFFYYLKKAGYFDWLAFDVFPKETDTIETFNSTIYVTKKLVEITNRIDEEEMEELHSLRDPAKIMRYLYSIL